MVNDQKMVERIKNKHMQIALRQKKRMQNNKVAKASVLMLLKDKK